jgi:Na+-driven multidrug efflux pump
MGQNMGARKYENFGKILRICLISAGGIGILLGGSCYLFAEPLLSIYLTDEAAAIGYGVTRMSYICVIYFLCGLMDVMSGVLRGMGCSLSPMVVTVLGVCGFRLAWIYTIFQSFGSFEMLMNIYPITWAVTGIAMLIAYAVIIKKEYRKMIKA